ncbi:MAG TPA: response regulator [Noviherbaspirillum sp.]|jgi:twitching motility two-component system response regulator PilG|uniref:response regulator n=1 Tax=Noviherbaspirillum sp. TaxID=1926288 RepID=UPI002F92E6DB
MAVSQENQQAESRRFVLELLGFTEAERSLLSSTFRLTSRRPFRYAEVGGGERPDVYLANADNAEAMQKLRERTPNVHAPAVLIGQSDAVIEWPLVHKPIHWSRLFDTLDQQMRVAMLERVRRNAGAAAGWDGRARRAADRRAGAAAPAPSAPVAGALAHPAAQAPEAVLVVDDSATVRAFMRAKLAPFRLQVDFAEDGETALDMVQARHYRCVFLDVLMPGIDGYQVCKRIKTSAATRDSAVVMLSSRSSAFDKFRGSWSGCDAYLGKPVTERELLAAIARFLPSARRAAQGLLLSTS